jgi:hypothetical protein
MQKSVLQTELKNYEISGLIGPTLKPIYDFLLEQSVDHARLRRDVIKTVQGIIQRNGIPQLVVA